MLQGVYASECLNLCRHGKVLRGYAIAANRIRESRPSGMRWGAPGNVAHGGTVNPRHTTERVAWKPSA